MFLMDNNNFPRVAGRFRHPAHSRKLLARYLRPQPQPPSLCSSPPRTRSFSSPGSPRREFFIEVGLLLFAGAVASLLAWLTRNYQIEFVHRVARRISIQLYSDGIRRSLNMPYASFA